MQRSAVQPACLACPASRNNWPDYHLQRVCGELEHLLEAVNVGGRRTWKPVTPQLSSAIVNPKTPVEPFRLLAASAQRRQGTVTTVGVLLLRHRHWPAAA